MALAESSTTDRTDSSADGRLLTTDEVAEILRVSPRTVRRMGARGDLARIRLGYRTMRYRSESVAALIGPAAHSGSAQ